MTPGELTTERQCGACELCCKVMAVQELEKPKGSWCSNCDIGNGCKIYTERPNSCRTFYCGYLISPNLDEHWYPAKCKMIVLGDNGGKRISVHVDADYPEAWKKEPYYSELKRWSLQVAKNQVQLVVLVKSNAIVILPDRDVDLGELEENDRIFTTESG